MKRRPAWLLLLATTACAETTEEPSNTRHAGTKTGNGISLEFGTTALAFEVVDAGVGDAGLSPPIPSAGLQLPEFDVRIEVAMMRVSQIDVLPLAGTDCDAPELVGSEVLCLADRYRIAEDIEIDLLSGEATPGLDEYRLPPGAYQSVEVSLGSSLDSTAEVTELRVLGTTQLEGESLPFEFEFEGSRRLVFRAMTAQLDVIDGGSLRATLDFAPLFRLGPPGCFQPGLPTTLPTSSDEGCEPSDDALIDALSGSTQLTRGVD